MGQKLSETSLEKLKLMAWKFDTRALWALFRDIQQEVWRLENQRVDEAMTLDYVRKLGIVGQELTRRGFFAMGDEPEIHAATLRMHQRRVF